MSQKLKHTTVYLEPKNEVYLVTIDRVDENSYLLESKYGDRSTYPSLPNLADKQHFFSYKEAARKHREILGGLSSVGFRVVNEEIYGEAAMNFFGDDEEEFSDVLFNSKPKLNIREKFQKFLQDYINKIKSYD